MKARVWVTRTRPGADRLATALQDSGYAPIVAPVLRIEPVKTDLPAGPGSAELVIVLSAHAVHAVPQGYERYVAVGPSTREALRQAIGVEASVPDVATSEGLVAWLDDHLPTSALLVSGEGGRGVIEAALNARGVPCDVLIAYRRRALSPKIDANIIDAVEVGSGDGVERAAQVWFAAGGAPEVPVLVPSPRVGQVAAEQGFRTIVVCKGASSAALVNALDTLGDG